MILESVAAVVGDDEKAERYVRGWMDDLQVRLIELEDQVFESEGRRAALLDERERLREAARTAVREREAAEAHSANMAEGLRSLLDILKDNMPFFIPEDAMHGMLNGDFTRAKAVFESATRIDFSQFPLPRAAV